MKNWSENISRQIWLARFIQEMFENMQVSGYRRTVGRAYIRFGKLAFHRDEI